MPFRTTTAVVESRLRSKVGGTIAYRNLHHKNPLDPKYHEQFDLIIANYVLLVTCKNIEEYKQGLKTVSQYLKKGGHVLVVETLNLSYVVIVGTRFRPLVLKHSEVVGSFREAGFEVLRSDEESFHDGDTSVIDSLRVHVTFARKV